MRPLEDDVRNSLRVIRHRDVSEPIEPYEAGIGQLGEEVASLAGKEHEVACAPCDRDGATDLAEALSAAREEQVAGGGKGRGVGVRAQRVGRLLPW